MKEAKSFGLRVSHILFVQCQESNSEPHTLSRACALCSIAWPHPQLQKNHSTHLLYIPFFFFIESRCFQEHFAKKKMFLLVCFGFWVFLQWVFFSFTQRYLWVPTVLDCILCAGNIHKSSCHQNHPTEPISQTRTLRDWENQSCYLKGDDVSMRIRTVQHPHNSLSFFLTSTAWKCAQTCQGPQCYNQDSKSSPQS